MMKPGTSENDVDQHTVRRQYEFDRDLWLIEVEDAKRRHFLDDWLQARVKGAILLWFC